jgi:hypothetical protein
MTEELLNALNVIKVECEKHKPHCEGCPMLNGDYYCGIQEDAPNDWKLEKREVYF